MKIIAMLSIGYPGAMRKEVIEVPDDQLAELDDLDKDLCIDEYVQAWSEKYIQIWWDKA